MAGIDYAAANALWRRHRTALTRAERKARNQDTSVAWNALYALVRTQQAEWDDKGWPWPDDWARWERNTYDAEFALRRLA